MSSQLHVVLEMFKIVTNQLGDDTILFCNLIYKDLDLIPKVLNLSKLGHLDNHDVVGTTHPFHGLSFNQFSLQNYNTNKLNHFLDICHQMVRPVPTTLTS